MNNAVYGINGLMPPKAPNWMTELIAPEAGDLLMLIHAGDETDIVNYAIDLRGLKEGTVKDPTYAFTGENDAYVVSQQGMHALVDDLKAIKEWPDFMTIQKSMPTGAIIPKRVFCGCPIPITEWPGVNDVENLRYWILQLPVRALPVGDTVVEVCVNGNIYKYVVKRPKFAIHNKMDRTLQFYLYSEIIKNKNAVTQEVYTNKEGLINIDCTELKNKLGYELDLYEYKLNILLDEEVTISGNLLGTIVSFIIPKTEKSDEVSWKAFYRKEPRETAWLPLYSSSVTPVVSGN